MGTYLGAASTLTVAGVSTPFVERAAVVLLEGYLWDVAAAKEAMRHAAAIAHEADGRSPCRCRIRSASNDTSANSSTSSSTTSTSCWGTKRRSPCCSARPRTRRRSRRRRRPGLLVVMTRGAAGCVVLTAHGPDEVPAAPVGRVIDTTGAGDLFAAGCSTG